MSIVKNPNRYQRDRVLTAEGKVRHSATNGDAVAKAMFGMDRAQMEQCVVDNGLTERMKKHDGTPNGRYRMNLGNILRGLVRTGKSPVIGKHTVTSLDQAIAVDNYAPPVVPREPKAEKPAKAKVDVQADAQADLELPEGDAPVDNSLEAANRRATAKINAEKSAKTAGKPVQGKRTKKAA